MNKRLFFFVVLLMSIALLFGCGNKPDKGDQIIPPTQEQGSGKDASAGLTSFKTTDIYGEEQTQEIFSGYDLTLVNVWGTFCKPCLNEMPDLGELQKEYEPTGVNIVGIVIDVQDNDMQVIEDQKTLAQEIVSTTGAGYPHLLISEEMIEPVLSQFDAIPASFFVDGDGNIVSEFYIGSKSKDEWKSLIDKMHSN
ncbi:TlpA family protein disulfide reductase [Anoxybacterium hadale]|uniref:TlpA family protein disulfide reductase n=1 Tax=Anoxybacterium hadale TaxID=3408580 RepID=A0ACD1A9H2_9FIRM|nr:TlpA family protein disulfide reductase [Clostridiales bacterium]